MERKLYRLKNDRKVCGVCSGIAQYLNVDVAIIRILWVIVSIFGMLATGIILYIACALIIPEEPDYFEANYHEK